MDEQEIERNQVSLKPAQLVINQLTAELAAANIRISGLESELQKLSAQTSEVSP
jgi:hypothetical protein